MMLNTNSRYKKILPQDWPGIISAWKNSNQPQKVFCQERNIGFSQFKRYYYGDAKKPRLKDVPKSEAGDPLVRFAPVKVISTSLEMPMEIHFPSGVVIKVPGHMTMASVIEALGAYL